ncbi:MAG: integrase core domain-containing protein [Methylococcales bacterium]
MREHCGKKNTLLADARSLVESYVNEYNTKRLHSTIGYITPLDKLEGRADAIFAARREKLQRAAKTRIRAFTSNPQAQAA